MLPRVATFPGRHKIPSSDLRVRYVPTNYHSYVGIYLGDVLRTLLRDPAHCGGYPIYGQCEKYCAGVDILEGPITRDLARQTIPWPCPLTTNNGTAEVKSRCPPQLPCSRTSVRMPLRCAVLRDLASERPKSALSSAAQYWHRKAKSRYPPAQATAISEATTSCQMRAAQSMSEITYSRTSSTGNSG